VHFEYQNTLDNVEGQLYILILLREQSLLMLGGGGRYLEGHLKCINHLGGYQKYQRKVGGPPRLMYNNHKTSAIIVHCNINVNAI
jgi:hypothetical protein